MHRYLLLTALLILETSGCQKDARPQIDLYPAIPGLISSDIFQISVNGNEVWTEKILTDFDLTSLPAWFTGAPYVNRQQEIHIANFSARGKISIQIMVTETVDSVSVHPLSRGIEAAVEGSLISFEFTAPEYLYVEVDSLAPLCIFASPPESRIPDSTAEDVLYFRPGIHRTGMLHPVSNTTIYIAGGAIVYGGIETEGKKNIRIMGRGILDGQFNFARMVELKRSTMIEVTGIMIRNGRSWTNTIVNCDSVFYRDVKVISFRPGGDGINPLNSRQIRIDRCFLRCTDDCIAIKAPDENINSSGIRVTNNTMIGFAYSDGCTIGFETNGPAISDILVKNCDIIQARGGSRVDGHAAFSIICDGPSSIHDIRYEEIRVESDVLKLFELHITDGTKYGIDPPGHIRDIYLQNIRWASERPVILSGFDENHRIENVWFKNCTVAGWPLRKVREKLFTINRFVKNVQFQ